MFAMFALAGMMFDSLMKKNRLHKMYLVDEHINQYMTGKEINDWIDDHGGWDSFADCKSLSSVIFHY